MTEDTIQHPATSPTTTINFTITSKIIKSRKPEKLTEGVGTEKVGVFEYAGYSSLRIKFSFELFSDATKAAVELWDKLDTLMHDYGGEDMQLTLNYDTKLGAKTQTFDGRLTFLTADADQGDPDRIAGSLAFGVGTKNIIT